MLRFKIESNLQPQWEEILVRQLHLILSPVLTDIKFGVIALYTQHDHSSNQKYYCCKFNGHGNNNTVFYAYTQHTEGRIAIRDAFSRVRREVIRRNRRLNLNSKTA